MLIRYFPLWKKAPFLRLVTPFISGIASGWYVKPATVVLYWIVLAALTCLVCTAFLRGYFRHSLNWVSGFMLSILVFCMGNMAIFRQDIRNNKQWLGWQSGSLGSYALKILIQPVEKANYFSFTAEIIATKTLGKSTPQGKILIRLQKDSAVGKPMAGDLILTQKMPAQIPDNANPGAFNFQFYCLQQGITHLLYLSGSEYQLSRRKEVNIFQKWIVSMQENVLQTIRKYVPGKKQAGIAEALLIGYREDLDKSLVQSYANTGVVHIIAISGLHLGMLYGLLLILLRPLKKFPKTLQLGLILAGLWLFSLIAGASPSVLRSAMMFSFIAIGNSVGKKANIFNTLSASAFFLLWMNPFYLWDLGFQLSYAAVVSIAVFQKPVSAVVETKNKLLDATWKLIAVSLAAQILTTPVSIFQFHQQPLLFLVANAVAVPLSGMVLYAEILLLTIAKLDWLARIVGETISLSLDLLNRLIERLDATAVSVWEQIHFSFAEMVIAYLVLTALAYWLFTKQKKYLFQFMLWVFCFVVAKSYEDFSAGRQEKIIVYQLNSHTAIDFVSGQNFYELTDSGLPHQASLQKFQISPAHNKFRMRRTDSIPGLSIRYPFIFYRNKCCLVLDKQARLTAFRNGIRIDFVLLRDNPRVNILELSQIVDCSLIVWDDSNSKSKTDKWKSECDALALRCHSTPLQGPLILEF